MTGEITNLVAGVMPRFEGYVYPNEAIPHPLWGFLIVLYPYITGLVAGAFIMASLVRVFKVQALEPVYRLALLTALSFLLCATLPLLFHLGHPERCYEIMMTPHFTSPMAMFGFVYAWYLMAVLLLELWFDYRHDLVRWAKVTPGFRGFIYRAFTVGVTDESPKALALDEKLGWILSIVGIPSAFLLHGYVGFIFGSIKANPWWGNVLMPIIFILSAVVSGIALCVFVYMVLTWTRRHTVDMRCLDTDGHVPVLRAGGGCHRGRAGLAPSRLRGGGRLFHDADHDPRKTLLHAESRPGCHWHVAAAVAARLAPAPAPARARTGPPPHDFRQRGHDPGRRAGHALERRDWRTAFLQEPARRDGLQTGIRRRGRLVHGDSSCSACRSSS